MSDKYTELPVSEYQRLLSDLRASNARAEAAEAELLRWKAANAKLRAQLDAGEGWRPFTEKPAHGQTAEIIITIRAIYYADDDQWVEISDEKWDGWRPAPPQE